MSKKLTATLVALAAICMNVVSALAATVTINMTVGETGNLRDILLHNENVAYAFKSGEEKIALSPNGDFAANEKGEVEMAAVINFTIIDFKVVISDDPNATNTEIEPAATDTADQSDNSVVNENAELTVFLATEVDSQTDNGANDDTVIPEEVIEESSTELTNNNVACPARPTTQEAWNDFYALFDLATNELEKGNSNSYGAVATTATHHEEFKTLQAADDGFEWLIADGGKVTIPAFSAYFDGNGIIIVNHYGDDYVMDVVKGTWYAIVPSNNLGGGNNAVAAIWEALFELCNDTGRLHDFKATVIGNGNPVFEMVGTVK